MELLANRESLRSAGKEVKAKRVAAGTAESALMGKLRNFIHEYWSELPSEILEAYDNAEQSRNILGVVEEEYLQNERELAGEEWKVMDQENKFYQFDLSFAINLCSHKIPNGRYRTVAKEVNNLRNAFDQLRKEQAHDVQWAGGDEVLFPDGLGLPCDDPKAILTLPVLKGLEILEKLHSREVAAQKLKPQDGGIFDGLPTKLRRNSGAAHSSQLGVSCTAPMRRTQTEGAAFRLNEDPTMREKIRGWSFEYMRMNVVEQKHYLNALEEEGVVDSMDVDWKERAAFFWGTDSWTGFEEKNNSEASSAGNVSFGAKPFDEGTPIADPGASAFPPDDEGYDESDLDYDDYDGSSVVFIPLGSHPLQDEAAAVPLPPSPPLLHEPGDELEPSDPYLAVTLEQIPASEEIPVHFESVPVHCNALEQSLSSLHGSHNVSERKDSCLEDIEIKEGKKKTGDPRAQHGSLRQRAIVPENVSGTVASFEWRESMPQLTTKTSFTVSEVVNNGMNMRNHPATSDIKIKTPPRDKVLCTSSPSPPKPQRRKSAVTILRSMKTRVFKGKIGRSKSTPDVKENRSLSNT
ncbi:hypothetical protein TW65_87024 [Stemphylium lycopersici]|nr:hypothetical protein TW65_87024 [Stemphylium lycopersici]